MTITAVLLDIEGTTTPIDFVHKTLFPYARENLGHFIQANFDIIQEEIGQLRWEHGSDDAYEGGFDKNSRASVIGYLHFLIDADRKSTPLKSLQGRIWQAGYESGELRSEVFPDVPRALARWRAAGKTIALYSSGSVLAQRLLFRFSDQGDLTPFISAYFDTITGPKRAAESYSRIARAMERPAGEILFLSDVSEELDAAAQSGYSTCLSVRPGNFPTAGSQNHAIIRTFDEIT